MQNGSDWISPDSDRDVGRGLLRLGIKSGAHGLEDFIAGAGLAKDGPQSAPLEVADFGPREISTHEDSREFGRDFLNRVEYLDPVASWHPVVE